MSQSKIYLAYLKKYLELDVFDSKVNKFLRGMESKDVVDLYDKLTRHNTNIDNLVILDEGESVNASIDYEAGNFLHPAQTMMYFDTVNYLPNDILAKVDRAAMAFSLETRLPFLHHELVKFAWSLPFEFKYRNGETKLILRKVLEKYVPSNLYTNNKVGFTAPLDAWLRGPLKEWASNLLNEHRIKSEGYLNSDAISYIWNQHLNHGKNYSEKLWGILSFQSWLESNKYATST
jgi:asparagine synthase (glutamine-hydrolysing)